MGCGGSLSYARPASKDTSQPCIGTDDSTQSLMVVQDVVDATRNSVVEPTVIPEYWYNKRNTDQGAFDDMYYVPDREHGRFDELLAASYVARCTQDRPCPKGQHSRTPGGCPCVQPGGDPGLPVAFRVHRVIRVEASAMWGRYHAKREKIKSHRGGAAPAKFEPKLLTDVVTQKNRGLFAPLDTELNEVYLYHGTFVRYALSIAQNDFNIDLAGCNRGTLFGRGAYLGESITKADEYAKDEPNGFYAGVFAVLVCRVCMGKLYSTSGDDPEAGSKIQRGEFDSTCGHRLFRELVIYDADQLYPEYVVLYKRVYKQDAEEDIAKTLRRRFFMEIPLHWRNTAKPLTEGFCEQHRSSTHCNEFFQCLVDHSLQCCSHKVRWSSRIENAELWQRYVNCRDAFRRRSHGEDQAAAADSVLSFKSVDEDIKELTRWPCRFFQKGSCKFAEKCHYSHNEVASKLSNVALAAGRRLPVDELDEQLNEHFLWYVSNKRGSNAMSKGSFRKEGTGRYDTKFFTCLGDALQHVQSEGGIKYAMLCRVLCGVPGTDSMIMDWAVCFWNAEQVYPEYLMELHSQEDEGKDADVACCAQCGSGDDDLTRHETMVDGQLASLWLCAACIMQRAEPSHVDVHVADPEQQRKQSKATNDEDLKEEERSPMTAASESSPVQPSIQPDASKTISYPFMSTLTQDSDISDVPLPGLSDS